MRSGSYLEVVSNARTANIAKELAHHWRVRDFGEYLFETPESISYKNVIVGLQVRVRSYRHRRAP